MMLTLLKASGFALRGADPAAMKDFVVAVHARAGEATAAGQITSRAEVLLLYEPRPSTGIDVLILMDHNHKVCSFQQGYPL